MGGAVGPPYALLDDAVRDVESVAAMLTRSGDKIDIVVWRGGKPTLLETLKPKAKPQPARARRPA